MNAWHDARDRLCAVLAGATTLALALAWHWGAPAWTLEAFGVAGVLLWFQSDD